MKRSTSRAAITTLTSGLALALLLGCGSGPAAAAGAPLSLDKAELSSVHQVRRRVPSRPMAATGPAEVHFAGERVVGLTFETGKVTSQGTFGGYDSYQTSPFEGFFGNDASDADRPSSYSVSSGDDPAFAGGVAPSDVHRKSKIVDSAQVGQFPLAGGLRLVRSHQVFLTLPAPMKEGARYTVDVDGVGEVSFTYTPDATFSEAVHVSQAGFENKDPLKAAYLSTWLGQSASSGQGSVDYSGAAFEVIDTKRGRVVAKGRAELDEAASDPTVFNSANFNLADVYKLDFSNLKRKGTYKVCVDKVGCSFEFRIDNNAWDDAFATVMRGFYHQRSGVELKQPYAVWERPRDLHPSDRPIYRSTATLMDTSMGLNLERQSSFQALKAGKTDETDRDAWGGWHDAADWDRRAQHLEVVRKLAMLQYLAPQTVRRTKLPIPERTGRMPDVLDEALWALDLWTRLQRPDGGVPGGIESEGHPKYGEGSWQESQDVFVYAPDPWSSYLYAGAAARMSQAIKSYDRGKSSALAASAVSAMEWAEANLSPRAEADWQVRNARNLAAVELYDLTGEARWHDLFQATSVFTGDSPIRWTDRQYDAGHVYATTKRTTNPGVEAKAYAAIVERAEQLMSIGDRAFGQIVDPYAPYGYAYTSTTPADPDDSIVLAHALTGRKDFLEAIIGDAQFGLGANPDNTSFLTGLGERQPRRPLVADMEVLGETPPPGLMLFGHWDHRKRGTHPSFDKIIDPAVYPRFPNDWPVHELFQGVPAAVVLSEYSIPGTMGPTAFVYGYLATAKR